MITTTLNDIPTRESWGVRDLIIEVLECKDPECVLYSEELTGTTLKDTDVIGWTTNRGHGTNL